MKRIDFLKKTTQAGLCGCGAVLGLTGLVPARRPGLGDDLWKRMQKASMSPDWLRFDKAQSWIKNMIMHMDESLDEPTKTRLLNACGRSCFLNAFGVADEKKPSAEEAEGFLKSLEQQGFKVARSDRAILADFGYAKEQNPWGLSIREGFCMCPITESDLPDLSPSYCLCSAGYIKEIFERFTGRTVRRVEVLESIRRGGKDCRFRVEISLP